MTTTDTLLADLADVLDRASKLAARMAETLAAPPSYHPERAGTLGELATGDRIMTCGEWREAGTVVEHANGWSHVGLEPDSYIDGPSATQYRIQKRHGNALIPDDPLRSYRLPSGRVAYAEEAARWVHVGDWIQAVHGDEGRWEQVVGTVHADAQTGITSSDGTRTRLRWWGHHDKVRVATAPVPDPEPYR